MALTVNQRRRIFWSALLLGTVCGAVIMLLQVRQAGMDAALIAAIRRDDTAAALGWLEQGASANAESWIGPPISPHEMVANLLRRARGRDVSATGFHAPALYMVCARYLRPRNSLRPQRARVFTDYLTYRNGLEPDVTADTGLLKALLDHGADPNIHPGRTGALAMAIRLDRAEWVRLLLEHRANPNEIDDSGRLPLMNASPECARLLIEHGANVNAHAFHGLTPLMCTAAESRGTDMRKTVLLLEHGAAVNARDNYNQTPLMHAIDVPTARLLLTHGADIDARDRGGMTALMMECAGLRSDPDLPRFLVAQGARVSDPDGNGKRAIDYARETARTISGTAAFTAIDGAVRIARSRVELVNELASAQARERAVTKGGGSR